MFYNCGDDVGVKGYERNSYSERNFHLNETFALDHMENVTNSTEMMFGNEDANERYIFTNCIISFSFKTFDHFIDMRAVKGLLDSGLVSSSSFFTSFSS